MQCTKIQPYVDSSVSLFSDKIVVGTHLPVCPESKLQKFTCFVCDSLVTAFQENREAVHSLHHEQMNSQTETLYETEFVNSAC